MTLLRLSLARRSLWDVVDHAPSVPIPYTIVTFFSKIKKLMCVRSYLCPPVACQGTFLYITITKERGLQHISATFHKNIAQVKHHLGTCSSNVFTSNLWNLLKTLLGLLKLLLDLLKMLPEQIAWFAENIAWASTKKLLH